MAREELLFFFSSLRSVATIKLKIRYHFSEIFLHTIHFCLGVYRSRDYYSLCLFLRYFVKLGHDISKTTNACNHIHEQWKWSFWAAGFQTRSIWLFSIFRNKMQKGPRQSWLWTFSFFMKQMYEQDVSLWPKKGFISNSAEQKLQRK